MKGRKPGENVGSRISKMAERGRNGNKIFATFCKILQKNMLKGAANRDGRLVLQKMTYNRELSGRKALSKGVSIKYVCMYVCMYVCLLKRADGRGALNGTFMVTSKLYLCVSTGLHG